MNTQKNTFNNHQAAPSPTMASPTQTPGAGPVVCEDGLARTPWAAGSAQLRDYYDNEWGIPVHDEAGLFERICLESFQAGLSWALILSKREAFRTLFHGFDPDQVAGMTENEIDKLSANPAIIRNRRKVEAAVTNARATVALREEGGLDELIWSFIPDATPTPSVVEEVPTRSPESAALSRALKKAGFVFVGPTTCYALMEAIGMVDTHLMGSHRRGCSGLWPE